MEKRKELLTDGLRKMALKTIHIPHTESSSYQDSINQVEAIENLKWKVNYYDGLDFNPKKIPITSLSLLMVQIPNANIEGDKPNSQYNFYAITSPSMWGKKEYPTWGVKIVNGIENRLAPRWRWDQKGSTIKGRIVDGKNDWGTKVFPPSKNYMERVVLLRSNWYFDKPLFLNWLDESPLEEKN